MAWTTPRTWATNELVTADMMNEQLRDNANALMDKPDTQIVNGSGTDFTTTSSAYVDITGFSATFTKRNTNSRLLILVRGAIYGSGAVPFLAAQIGATNYEYGGVWGFSNCHSNCLIVISGIDAGSVTVKLRLKSSIGGSTVGMAGGTSRQMVVIEGSI